MQAYAIEERRPVSQQMTKGVEMITEWKPTGLSYRGIGEVKREGKLLARVRYELSEMQEFFTIKQLGLDQPPPRQGEKQIRGTISVLNDENTIPGGEKWLDKYDFFDLHMADGRVAQAKIVPNPRGFRPIFKVTVEFLE